MSTAGVAGLDSVTLIAGSTLALARDALRPVGRIIWIRERSEPQGGSEHDDGDDGP